MTKLRAGVVNPQFASGGMVYVPEKDEAPPNENFPLKVTDTGTDVPQLFPTILMGKPRGSTDLISTLNDAVAVTARVERSTFPVTGFVAESSNVAVARPIPASLTVVDAGGSVKFPLSLSVVRLSEPTNEPGGTVTV